MRGNGTTRYMIEQSGDAVELTLGGFLGAQHAHALQEAIVHAFETARHINIKFANVTGIDLECLKLFCEVYRASIVLGKRVSVTGDFWDVIAAAFKSTGFSRLAGCGVCEMADEKDCLWVSGGREGARAVR